MYSTYGQYLGTVRIPDSNLRNKSGEIKENYTVTGKVIDVKIKEADSTKDPKVWGPPFWYSLHVSAAHYPVEASPLVKERMKGRILAIPYEIPCSVCRPHASAFIEKSIPDLDRIVSGRHSLGQFYVDFHNIVNRRYGKPEWNYEKAYKLYSGETKINYV